MKSYRSSPIGLALFVFGILAFNAYTDMASAQICPSGITWTWGFTFTSWGCSLKCGGWCLLGLKGSQSFFKRAGFFTSSCTCCCHPAFRPPAPAPPPPVSGLCDPNAITNSFITTCPCTCPPCPKGPARFNGLCARNVCSCCCNA